MGKHKLKTNAHKAIHIDHRVDFVHLLILNNKGYTDNVITYTFIEFLEIMKIVAGDFLNAETF